MEYNWNDQLANQDEMDYCKAFNENYKKKQLNNIMRLLN